jgi:hypothetical protein
MKCAYLIYTEWTTKFYTGSTIGGSLLHPELLPQTEEEAKQMIATLQERSEDFYAKYAPDTIRRYVYIANRAEWWSR